MKKTPYYTLSALLGALLKIEGVWSLFNLINSKGNLKLELVSIFQTLAIIAVVLYVAYKLRKLENRSSLYEAIFIHSVYKAVPTNSGRGNLADLGKVLMANGLKDAKEDVERTLLNLKPNLSKSEAESIVNNFYDSQISRLEKNTKKDIDPVDRLR